MSPDAYLAQPNRKRMFVLHWMLPVLAMQRIVVMLLLVGLELPLVHSVSRDDTMSNKMTHRFLVQLNGEHARFPAPELLCLAP